MATVAYAQSSNKGSQILSLQTGDSIPQTLWNLPLEVVNHDKGKKVITLKDYRDKKLIILDFWATWCAPCIKSLQKLDTIQKELRKDLAVIPITYQPGSEIEKYLKDNGYSLPSVVSDKVMKETFPYVSIPHQIWIRDGKVLAVAGHRTASRENLRQAILGNEVRMIEKNELMDFSLDRPLDLLSLIKKKEDVYFISTLLPRVNIQASSYRQYSSTEYVYFNMTAPTMLCEVFLSHLPYYAQNDTRIKFEVDSMLKSKIYGRDKKITGNYEEDLKFVQWADSFQFCYYLNTKGNIDPLQVKGFIRTDMNRYFSNLLGIESKVKVVPTSCVYLAKSTSYKSLKTKGGRKVFDVTGGHLVLENVNIGELVASIGNTFYRDKKSLLPVVDFSNIDYNIDLKIPLDRMGNIEMLKASLATVGLEIKEGIKPVEMLVISQVDR